MVWYAGSMDYLRVSVMFLSAVWTDGTHSLQRIHWYASDVMLNLLSQTESVLFVSSPVSPWGFFSW